MMRFAIVGVGGVGGLLGGLLGHAGHDVRFVARGRSLSALRERGLVLRRPVAEIELRPPVRAAEEPADLAEVDVVFVAVKAWQVGELAPRLAPLVHSGVTVVPLQNGVDAGDTLARVLGDACVAGGLCHMVAWAEEPGVVRDSGVPPSTTLSVRVPSQTERIGELARVLTGAGIATNVVPSIDAALWAKLLFLAPLATVGAIARAPIGVVRSDPRTRDWLEEAMREIEAVARSLHVALPADVVERALARIDALPEDATASMHRDLLGGRPSELDDLTGALVRRANDAGVAVPRNAALLAELSPLERAARAVR